MLTRLKVKGFKNLRETDIEFGSFTCIAGVNAVGKSNLFDAINFLSKTATENLGNAAKGVRSEGQKASELRDIFFKSENKVAKSVRFEADLIIPPKGEDELGEVAVASITTVKYILDLGLRTDDDIDRLEINEERLEPITQRQSKKNLKFQTTKDWVDKVVIGRRSANSPFISTDTSKGAVIVRLHQDKQKGKPFDRNPEKMGRTVLSTASAEFPTAFLVKEELRSWVMLQLEPSALRKSDELDTTINAKLAPNGSFLPATLYRLANENKEIDYYQRITNKLHQLIDDVSDLWIERDEKRRLLTLILKTKDGSEIPARSLSEGTLRFLALATLEEDSGSGGLICLEEPENGIHPKKIDDIIQLLQGIACDPKVGNDENNLRQVIINTHSPLVVKLVPEDALLMAESHYVKDPLFNKKVRETVFHHLSGTWRDDSDATKIVRGRGTLLSYLGEPANEALLWDQAKENSIRRVVERKENNHQGKLFNDD